MPNNVPRNHHYVCEFLLKHFADENGTLWIYDSAQQKYWAGNTVMMLAEPGPEDEHSGALGLRSSNIELVMPMSRRMVAVARRDGLDSFGELVKGSAETVNARTLSYARRFVFASYRSDDLLAAVVRQRSSGPKLRSRRMQIDEQPVLVSEYR